MSTTSTLQTQPGQLRLRPFESDHVRLTVSSDGRVDASVRTPSGQWIRLQSAHAPEAEAQALVERTLGGREVPPVVAVIGVGLGYVVDELLRRRTDVRVVALEVIPEVSALWLERCDLTQAFASGQLVVGEDPSFNLARAAWPASVIADDPLVIVPPVVAHHWPDGVERARHALRQFMFERRANEEARQRLAPIYLEHILQNLPALARSADVSALDGIAAGDPLVLCGAGPSLDRLLPSLKANRGRAWYVALDTSVRPLLAAGIVPDLVVSIDPTMLNGRHLVNLPTRTRPWLVADMSVDPCALTAFSGRTFACRVNRADPWGWLEQLDVLPTAVKAWGSVLTAACDVVSRMKPSSVAFAGVDLAYTNAQPYCRGTVFENEWEAQRVSEGLATIADVWRARLKDLDVFESDVHGQPVLTAGHMIAFRNWARTLTAEAMDCAFANVSDAGILHGDRIEQCDLDSWLARWPGPAVDPESKLQSVAHPRWIGRAAQISDAARAAVARDDDPWSDWEARVPAVDRDALSRIIEHSARRLRALKGSSVMNAQQSEWIDVPYDPANFQAREPMEWKVDETNVGTLAYRIDGKTMLLSFKINNSSLAGYPSNELYLRLPAGCLAARGAANPVWVGSPSGKEIGYATIHPGESLLIVYRSGEERFPIDAGYFFVFGQMTIEIQ